MTSHHSVVMIQVSIDDIARDVRTYIQRVQAGEIVVISDSGHLVAELNRLYHL